LTKVAHGFWHRLFGRSATSAAITLAVLLSLRGPIPADTKTPLISSFTVTSAKPYMMIPNYLSFVSTMKTILADNRRKFAEPHPTD